MTNSGRVANVAASRKFRNFLRPRDIFLHDGKSLRRVTISVPLQLSALLAAFSLIVWSTFAAMQFVADGSDTARLERQLRLMQADVAVMEQVAKQRYDLTTEEVKKLGLDPNRFQGTGGPFEAVQPLKAADPKFKQLFMSWKKLDQLEQGTIAIPSLQPVKGTSLTSSYGVRSDPFKGRAAMHAGIDLAGPIGTPIYATADGFVGRSQWVNGYGNLVEIEHGRGIQTRYGHLSRSVVKPGQRVKRGDLIAMMGSTGRSTGSHLHYEVRIDGKAVNPVPFMQANDYLLAVQRRVTQFAMGGPTEGTK
jgi:murein DD-endopeptidase MepM/ murein hydrolase activator NlpD